MNSPVMQGLNLNTPSFVKNARLIAWVADMVALCKPKDVVWCDGSEEEYQRLCQQLVDAGTFKKLDQVRDYTDYPGYGTAVYVLYNAAGGSTTITQPVTLFDENTCYAVEVLRGKIVRHLTWRQVANASGALTWSSPTATATGPAIAFFDWRGSGSVFSPALITSSRACHDRAPAIAPSILFGESPRSLDITHNGVPSSSRKFVSRL